MHPWVQVYSPKTAGDVIGHEGVAEKISSYLKSFSRGDKPLLLAGKPGVGKTCLVHCVARELDREILEINASDTRNKASINALLGPALHQQSLFFKEKVILIDEVDGLSGTKDRGGIPTLIKLMDKSSHPVILIANDSQLDKIKALRKKATVVEMAPPSSETIAQLLSRIAAAEKIHLENEMEIARRSGGDVRAAINDLQSLVTGDTITKESVDQLSDREQKQEIVQALLQVFKTTKPDVALPAYDLVTMEPGEILLWIEENITKEYTKPEDLARALDALAEADRYLGRIRRWQYYRFYVYAYNLLSAGVALAKDEKYPGMREFKRSQRPLKIWIYNNKNLKRKKLAAELAPQLHTSTKRVRNDVLPFLKHIWRSDREKGQIIAETYDLDEENLAWFDK